MTRDDEKTEPTETSAPRPQIRRIAKSADFVQGAGGMSGQDINWYYHFWN